MAGTTPKVLFISHDSGRTGAPIGLLALMRWLRRTGSCEVGTILRASGPLEPAFRELGPTLVLGRSPLARFKLGRRLLRRVPRLAGDEAGKVRAMFRAGGYDAIYSNTITNGRILEALAPCHAPALTHVHELQYWISRAGPENLSLVLQHTAHFVAASRAVRDNLVRNHKVPSDKITVVYEHIRTLPEMPAAAQRASIRQTLGIPENAFVVGGCGAEHWRKGRDLIPQLLLTLRRLQPGVAFHFLWVGRPGTPEEEFALKHDLRQAGVEARFHTSGEVGDPFPFYAGMDAFALLSRDDPFPLACLEAAGMGIPLVCFADAGGMPEFVSQGCGSIAPYLDLETMALGIMRMAGDPTTARACGLTARERVARDHLVEATGPQLLVALKTLRARCQQATRS